MQQHKLNSGFTLVEMVITLTVIAILAGIAVPSFTETLDRRRVSGAAEQLQSDLQYARSEAIRRNADVIVSFVSGTSTWCYGIDTTVCTCTTANDCQLDGVTKVVDQTGFRGVSLTQNFGDSEISFDPRTFDLDNGTATFTSNIGTSNARVVSVKVGQVGGRIKLCSPSGSTNIPGYGAC